MLLAHAVSMDRRKASFMRDANPDASPRVEREYHGYAEIDVLAQEKVPKPSRKRLKIA
jgi:hypothetical protein